MNFHAHTRDRNNSIIILVLCIYRIYVYSVYRRRVLYDERMRLSRGKIYIVFYFFSNFIVSDFASRVAYVKIFDDTTRNISNQKPSRKTEDTLITLRIVRACVRACVRVVRGARAYVTRSRIYPRDARIIIII